MASIRSCLPSAFTAGFRDTVALATDFLVVVRPRVAAAAVVRLVADFFAVLVLPLVVVFLVAIPNNIACYTNLMKEVATLGGGCYWCLDALYRRIKGVESIVSGYSGGYVENPTSDQVYSMTTGHAEVVQVTFNPRVITYKEILEIFFAMHDPTTLNRQGPDVGEIYRSAIFYHSDEQKKIAEDMIKNFAPEYYKDPIVTQLEPYEAFYPATEDQQDFYNSGRRPDYCAFVIDPKIQKLRQKFAAKLKL